MASLRVLAFDHEGRPIQFDTWLNDLQLYLLSDSRDSVSLFDHTPGAAPAPPATADSATRSQWLTRDAAACLAICNHLPLAEYAHFRQHRTAQALYDDVVALTAGAGGTGGTVAAGLKGARTRGTGAAGTGSVGGSGAGGGGPGHPAEPGGAGVGGARAGGTGAGGAGAGGAASIGAGGTGPGGAGAGGAGAGATRAVDPGAGGAGAGGAMSSSTGAGGTVRPRPYFVHLLQQVIIVPSSTGLAPPLLCGLTERREPTSRPVSPVRTGRRGPHLRPPPVRGTLAMALCPSSVPLRVPLPPPRESSLLAIPDPESVRARATSPTVSHLLATVVTDPSFESTAASALVAELLDFAAACCLDYATALVAKSESAIPLSVGGECALGTDVLEDRQEDFECLGAAVPRFASMLLALEGDPNAPDIPTPRSYAKAITVPLSRANIVDGMRIFKRAYELHFLDFSTAFLQGSLHEEIWLRRPPGFTGSFPAGFTPSTANPSLFLRTDTSMPPFYVLVYVDGLVFATADTEALTLVLQRFGFQFSLPQPTPLSTGHSLSAPTSDESVEPSGPYPELVGCLMYLMTCTRPDLVYPLSLLARYVAPGRHRKVHWDVAKRVLCYLCSTLGMGLVLGGRGSVVLTGHANASWVDDLATQRSSQGYTFSLGSGSVSWQSTRSSSVLSSRCEAEIYAGAMAAQ
ncbi:unnamed protein product [Closterium sp. NIES-53]